MWDQFVASAAAHWSKQYRVAIDPNLVHAIIERESRHGRDQNYLANGSVVPEPGGHYSYGPMQVYDDTVRDLNPTLDPRALALSPGLGIWYGTHYLAKMLDRFGADTERAIAAYNSGPGNAVRYGGVFRNQGYVNDVLAFWKANRVSILPALLVAGAVYLVARRRAA